MKMSTLREHNNLFFAKGTSDAISFPIQAVGWYFVFGSPTKKSNKRANPTITTLSSIIIVVFQSL